MSLLLAADQRNLSGSPYWSDYFNYDVDPILEIIDNKENLVICLGDSWTWGDSLGYTYVPNRIDDIEVRSKSVYGKILSDFVNADFINIAYPGIFNYWIHDKLQILLDYDLPRLIKKYKKIYIVVTLTEIGRDFEFEKYIDDFKLFYNSEHDVNFSGLKLTQQAESFDFFKLKQIQTQLPDNCTLVVGRNFTNTHSSNRFLVENLVPKNWTQVLFEPQGLDILSEVWIMSFGLPQLDKFVIDQNLNSVEYKNWIIDNLSPMAIKQIDLLNKSVYNYKKATKHPTPDGHRLWAEYLLSYIKENNI